ncbi:hypothetical protein PHSY_001515 [Pseudozyma hubeiensis SY62]|uniref:Uncharacterized protein n=1 Tax=Pseudozyma hubeiensis (strain SY62) TaxID=1305764 RepID=R9NZ02_PSEHS|nr:hypothetical protein PHSY_001515 [Pseudozyma hubeiensis SY62]GAC93946.1 hypothetical protein PHSY_001515 [Pseudozyma hubeiensis SY62]
MTIRAGACLLTIDVHIPCSSGQLDLHSILFLCHFDLAAQPARVCQAESEVQHVVFIVARFFQRVVYVGFENDVAGGTRYRAFAGSFEVNIVFVGDGEEIIPVICGDCFERRAFGIDKVNDYAFAGWRTCDPSVLRESCGGQKTCRWKRRQCWGDSSKCRGESDGTTQNRACPGCERRKCNRHH